MFDRLSRDGIGGMGGLSYEQVAALTMPQLANVIHKGKPPAPDTRKFSTWDEMAADAKKSREKA